MYVVEDPNACLLMMIEEVGHSELGLVERNDTEVREVWDMFTSESVQVKNNAKFMLIGKVILRKINILLCI